MSNRLAELENNIGRRAANRKKPVKQDKMRSALEKMQQPRQQPAPVAPKTPAPPAVAAQGLSGRVSRWPTRTARAMSSRAFNAISYDIPGNFWVLAQPSGMACWATVLPTP